MNPRLHGALHLGLRQSTCVGDARHLQQGVGDADVRVETGCGCRYGIRRDIRKRDAFTLGDLCRSLFDRGDQVGILGALVAAAGTAAVVTVARR